jgi:protein phosphatase
MDEVRQLVSQAFGLSDKGRVRKGNEDAFACIDDLRLFVVADGMGGHSAGEVASRLAIEAVVGFVRRSADRGEFSWPYGIDPTLSFDGNRLRTAIHLANRRVFRAAEEHDDYTGMGTTVVSALVIDSKLIVAHVGDSRLYVLSEQGLQQVTKDDSWAATILQDEVAGDKTALAKHPMRNVLTNVLGAREHTEIHLLEMPLRGGERLLLCSDGLHGTLGDADIEKVLVEQTDIATAAHMLVDAALDGGSRDNVTALVVRCDGAPA